jgi:hypothetical protein
MPYLSAVETSKLFCVLSEPVNKNLSIERLITEADGIMAALFNPMVTASKGLLVTIVEVIVPIGDKTP